MIVEVDLGVLTLELEEFSIDQLDLRLDVAMREKQREAFVECLTDQDVLENSVCPACNTKMSSLGFVTRKVGTLAGPVVLKRRRLRCRSCGTEHYPLDNLLGKGAKHTLAVAETALYLATDLSYDKASRAIEKLKGAEISHGQIQALAKREAAFVGLELDRMTSDLFGLGLDPGEIVRRGKEDTVVVSIDGGAIPDRSSKDDFEAKVGVVYGLKAQVSKNRVALVDRVCYASLENSFEFGKKLFCLARRHGVMSAGRVLAIGDGAGWIRSLIRDFFPMAIYLLDLFHLKQRIGKVLRDDEYESLRQEIYQTCLRGDPEGVLGLLERYVPKTHEDQEALRKLKHYIQTNRDGIANYVRSDLFGSGAVEKAVDIVVSRRFKLRGMSWLRPGAAGMLAFRMLKFNGEWDSHWQQRMAHAI